MSYFQAAFTFRKNSHVLSCISIRVEKRIVSPEFAYNNIAVRHTVFPISCYFPFILYFPKIITNGRDIGENPFYAIRSHKMKVVYQCDVDSHVYSRLNNCLHFLCKKQRRCKNQSFIASVMNNDICFFCRRILFEKAPADDIECNLTFRKRRNQLRISFCQYGI